MCCYRLGKREMEYTCCIMSNIIWIKVLRYGMVYVTDTVIFHFVTGWERVLKRKMEYILNGVQKN